MRCCVTTLYFTQHMKECITCKETKDDSDFSFGSRKERRRHCKECQRRSDQEKYRNRSPEKVQKDKTRRRENLGRSREWLRKIKNNPCLDCGRSFHFFVMDFDHTDPKTKKFDVGTAASQGLSTRALQEEVSKCDLVCSNCHRMRTYSRMVGDSDNSIQRQGN